MNKIKYILILCISSLLMTNCQDEDQEFGEITIPTNLALAFEIVGQDVDNPNGDGSGFVNFSGSADNAITYRYNFGDNTGNILAPSGAITHRFNLTGLNTYSVTITASGTGGVTSSTTIIIDVFSTFDDQEAKELLSGGSGDSKTWYPKVGTNGHLGVGPTLEQDLNDDGNLNGHWFPQYDSTNAFGKCDNEDTDCFCSFEITFSLDESNQLTYLQNNIGQTFFNWAHGAVVGQEFDEFVDTCFDFDTSQVSEINIVPSSTDWTQVADPDYPAPRGSVMNFSHDAFMGYYTGVSSYEILDVNENYLYVRFFDAVNPVLAWYQMFSTSPPNQITCEGGTTGDPGSGNFDVLVWSDEFDIDGEPCDGNWANDLGDLGNNNEEQIYTDEAENLMVEGGVLKISAIADGLGGYTSGRLKSENLFEFTFGRVDVRAKTPASQGTWPAIWLLGANFDSVGWPTCGEIDIMEQSGQDKNTVLGTVHWLDEASGNPADFGQSTTVSDATSEFHVYSLEWDANQIKCLVDDVVYFTFDHNVDLPFNSDFYLILNVAMGGTLGGVVDPAFTEDTMEIDYVRVYQ